MKQKKINEEKQITNAITNAVLSSLNPTASNLIGRNNNNNNNNIASRDNDDTGVNGESSSTAATGDGEDKSYRQEYNTRIERYQNKENGKLHSRAHKSFISELKDKLTTFNKLGLSRLKDLDTQHKLTDLEIGPKDELVDPTTLGRTPTVVLKVPIYHVLHDHYCKSVLLNSILRKLLPYVDIPYISDLTD